MKEWIDNFLTLCKGFMQPGITVAAIIVFVVYALSGKFAVDQVFQVVVGIMIFWFSYTAIKNFQFGGASATTPTTQANADLTQVVATQSEDLATSTPASVVNKILDKVNAPTVTATTTSGGTPTPAGNADPDPEDYLKEIS